MTNPRTFHFAVKPGEEPVQLTNLSAHSTLPWVARGYEFFSIICDEHFRKFYYKDIDSFSTYNKLSEDEKIAFTYFAHERIKSLAPEDSFEGELWRAIYYVNWGHV